MSRVGARDSLPTAVVETVRMLLRKVDPSANSVTGTSEFMSRWKEQAGAICSLLAEAYCSNDATSRNRLALFYVFNDLVQKFQSHFAECGMLAFLKVIASRISSEPVEDQRRYMRTVSIWQQRVVYPQRAAEKIRTLFRTKYPVQAVVTVPIAVPVQLTEVQVSDAPTGDTTTTASSDNPHTITTPPQAGSQSLTAEELSVVREFRKMAAASRALSAGEYHHVKQLAAARLAADVTDKFGVAVDLSAFRRLTWSEQQVLVRKYESGVQAAVHELEKLQNLGIGIVALFDENRMCLTEMCLEQKSLRANESCAVDESINILINDVDTVVGVGHREVLTSVGCVDSCSPAILSNEEVVVVVEPNVAIDDFEEITTTGYSHTTAACEEECLPTPTETAIAVEDTTYAPPAATDGGAATDGAATGDGGAATGDGAAATDGGAATDGAATGDGGAAAGDGGAAT
eukprot:Lankesteria_metandrocarpae@DN3079_c0_g1_i2.p1